MIFLKTFGVSCLAAFFLLTGVSFAAVIPVNNEADLRNGFSNGSPGDTLLFNSDATGTGPLVINTSSTINGTVAGLTLDGRVVGTEIGSVVGNRTFHMIYMGSLSLTAIQNVEINDGVSTSELTAGGLTAADITQMISHASFRRNTTTAALGGGGLFINGNLTGNITNNIHFDSNKALTGSGGGLYVNGNFSGELAGTGQGSHGDTHFDFNTAALDGGGMYVKGDYGSAAKPSRIYANYFASNKAEGGSGGGLYVGGSLTARIGEYAFFDKNTAAKDGAGMYVTQTFTGDIDLAWFTDNQAGGNGGGFYADSTKGNISRGNFLNNQAGGSGGGIYVKASMNGDIGNGSNFESNKALNGSGGGVYVGGDFAGNNMINNTFTKNTAAKDGGGMYVVGNFSTGSGGATQIMSSAFNENQAQGGSGGGLYVGGNFSANIDQNTIVNKNSATKDGGGIYVAGQFLPNSMRSARVTENQAGGNGGGIYADSLAGSIGEGAFFGNNTAGGSGGAMYIAGSSAASPDTALFSASMEQAVFDSNTAGGNGGALAFGNQGTVEGSMRNNTFSLNTAGSNGGAIATPGNLRGEISINTFTGNKANNGNGGAISARSISASSSSITVLSVNKFINNSASGSGGAVNIAEDISGAVNINGNDFSGNQALAGSGGGMNVRNILTTQDLAGNTFENNTAQIDGGGLNITGILQSNIKDGSFSGNKATTGNGGGMNVGTDGSGTSVKGNFTNMNFSSNTAQAGNGGGLNITDSMQGSLLNNTFDSNSAGGHGGGLNIGSMLTGDTTASFTKNSAVSNGGGMNVADSINGKLLNSTFDSNNAGGHGGGLNVGNSMTGDITASFTNNTATENGGGMNVASILNGSLLNSTFDSNTATGDGGGLNVGDAMTGDITADFKNNAARTGNGGGMNVTNNINGKLLNSTFDSNNAGGHGGGLNLWGTIKGDISASFTNNTATNNGGGMNVGSSINGNLLNSTFDSNTATGNGGGLNVGDTMTGDITAVFKNNTAKTGNGGGMNINVMLQGNIKDSSFQGNKASTGDGGGLNAASINGDLSNVNFTSNTAGANGGGLYVNNMKGNINGTTFDSNSAASNGGGMYLGKDSGSSGGSLTIGQNTIFNKNTATKDGGAIYTPDSFNANIEATRFTNNQAGGNGGAIYANSILTGTIGQGSYFGDNTAGASGGAIYLAGDNINGFSGYMQSTTFERNSAATDGGAIAIDNQGTLRGIIRSSTFSNNTAGNNGGAISAKTNLTGGIAINQFTDNKAVGGNGGAISMLGIKQFSDDIVYFSSNEFINNTAANNGGAVNFTEDIDGNIYVNQNHFSGNQALNGSGGGMSVRNILNETRGLLDNKFENNTAKIDGGGMNVSGILQANIQGGGFSGNKATTGNGGGLNVTDSMQGSLLNSTFDSNVAGNNGGGFALGSGSKLTFHNSKFTGNKAGNLGGGIYFETVADTDYDVTLSADAGNSTAFTGNTDVGGKNSFHVGGTDPNANFSVAIAGTGTVDLRDPFRASIGKSNFSLTHKAKDALLIMSGINDLSTNGGNVSLNFLDGVSQLVRDSGDFTLRVFDKSASPRSLRAAADSTNFDMTWGKDNTLTILHMEERPNTLALIDLTKATGTKKFTIEEGATLDITRVLKPLPNQRYLLVDGLAPSGQVVNGQTPDGNVRVNAITYLHPNEYSKYPMFRENNTQLWLDEIDVPDAFDPEIVPPNLVASEDCATHWLNYTPNGLALTPSEVLALRLDFDSGPPEAAATMSIVGTDIHDTSVKAAKAGLLEHGVDSLRQGEFRFWSNYMGGLNRTKRYDRYSGYKVHTNGVLLGMVWEPDPLFALGAYAGYSSSNTRFRNISAKADSDSFHTGLQASYDEQDTANRPNGWRVTADASYTHHAVDMTRTPGGLGKNSSSFGQDVAGLSLETAYSIPLPQRTRLAPSAMLKADWIWQDSFSESGEVMAAKVRKIQGSSLASYLGGTLEHDFIYDNGLVTPGLGVSWKYQFTGRQRHTNYAFVDNGNPDYPCVAKSRELGSSALDISAYIDSTYHTEEAVWSLRGGIGLEIGREAIAQTFYGGISVRF